MPIGNLGNKVSANDVQRVKDKRNPPEFEEGFEPSGDDGYGFGDMFEDLTFDSLGNDSGGASNGKMSAMSLFGGPTPAQAGGTPGKQEGLDATGTFGGFGGFGQPSKPVEIKPDTLDKIFDGAGEGFVSLGKVLLQLVKSIKNRTAEDYGYYSRNMIIASIVLLAVAILMAIMGAASDVRVLKLSGIPFQLIACATLSFGTGLIGISMAAINIANTSKSIGDNSSINNIPMENETETEDYEDNLEDIIGELFGDTDETEEYETELEEEQSQNIDTEKLDLEQRIENIKSKVPILSRDVLYSTFKPFFMQNTRGFAKRTDIDPESDQFATLETIGLKAIAAAAKISVEEIDSFLESATETYFSYELRMKRVKGLTRTEDISREMTAYFRESSDDTSVNSVTDLEGDFYKVIITKGVQAIVTYGDVLTLSEADNFFKDTKHLLPFIAGITDGGKPILVDGKNYDTLMVAGKQRSGKSWYVLGIMLSLMMFNSPEEVQFVLIDPKESYLFKTLGLMPHVCGVHNDENILQILKDIIDNEGARRKKLLSDHKCDTVWELRERKGIKLPILYIFIDEVMTVLAHLKDSDKEFFSLLEVVISQLPSQGIRLLFVPHRAQGVVSKTIRSLLSYTAAVRADNEIVCETLGIKKWDKVLVNPGDTALKIGDMGKELFVKGAAITTSDSKNAEFILSVARAFYKMGVDIPNMSSILSGYNRNEDYIKSELKTGDTSNRVQFNLSLDEDFK